LHYEDRIATDTQGHLVGVGQGLPKLARGRELIYDDTHDHEAWNDFQTNAASCSSSAEGRNFGKTHWRSEDQAAAQRDLSDKSKCSRLVVEQSRRRRNGPLSELLTKANP